MIIDEFKLALFSILGGFIGAVLSLFISGGTGWASAFFAIIFFILITIVLSLLLQSSKKEKIEQEEMMKLLKNMSRGSPSWYYSDEELKKYILTDDGINNLVKMNIINDDGKKSGHPYYITPTGIQLISSWESIKLNRKLSWLTFILIILGILNLILLFLYKP